MNLQTKIPLRPQGLNQIDYNSKIVLLGSCFSEHIGNKFSYFKFQELQNPFGILFHPLAIEQLITNAINQKKYTKEAIFFNNEQWHCFDAHSKLSHSSDVVLLQQLNSKIKETSQFIKEASHIVITLGTAWAYRYIKTDNFVANCHKIPQKQFLKELLSVAEITESLNTIITLVESVNPNANIIFTVSPVRHIKDGFVENMQSKAHLISAIHELLSLRAQLRSLSYFPSFEIMMDELRDYRFYNEDMLHPNATAVNYIWKKFKNVWITQTSQKTMEEVEDIQKGLAHKPFNPNSEAHQKFLSQLKIKQNALSKQNAHISF